MTRRPAVHLAAVAIVLGTGVVALAQDVPTLDYKTLCKAEAKAAPALAGPCEGDQQRAREDLVKQWSTFLPAERTSCVAVVNTIPGMQSYIELLTCLQMKRDVRQLPKQ